MVLSRPVEVYSTGRIIPAAPEELTGTAPDEEPKFLKIASRGKSTEV
jgi:hypothetical protein